VPRREPYVPKHRQERSATPRRSGVRTSVLLSGVAVAATGIAVSSGIVMKSEGSGAAASAASAAPTRLGDGDAGSPAAAVLSAADPEVRTRPVSRSDQRTSVDATKAKALDQGSGGQVTRTEDLTSKDPRTIARAMLSQFGFGADQFTCLDSIYSQESGWNVHAANPSSSAYGIPQALPGSKMSSAGGDWENDAATQIRWGLGYIQGRYGTPCGAWGFKQGHGWY
jgi:hypothetical protein